MGSSNLPPGGGYIRPNQVFEEECPNGHVWPVEYYFELGGWFLVDESKSICPECGEEALDDAIIASR